MPAHLPCEHACVFVAAQAHNGWSTPELLRLLGSLERGSSHPLAAEVLMVPTGSVAKSARESFFKLIPIPAKY